ncbi:MAG TPA: DUF1499 domain-containing protein [Candidatus Methylomirabilis sp.]|nr:DUF1499 domain-containing protein [Candidatus Methylomirabilis sp.]
MRQMTTSNNGTKRADDPETYGSRVKPRSRAGVIALVLALLSLFAAVASGFGYRLGLWTYVTGFIVLLSAAVVAMVSAALGVVGAYLARPRGRRRGMAWALAALALGAATASVPLSWLWLARHLPPIHDISTDTDHPPNFVAILPLRAGAPDPTQYGGAAVAALQHRAYPDVQPLLLPVPSAQVFDAALATARAKGWTIVVTDSPNGRIEATDTTFWFGFTDDIVVRITPQPDGGTRVDARSVSRVGRGDLGANARRLYYFLYDLADRLGKEGKLSRVDPGPEPASGNY